MTEEAMKEIVDLVQKEVMKEFILAEKQKKPSVDEMFNDVYDEIPFELGKQKQSLLSLMDKYPEDFEFSKEYET